MSNPNFRYDAKAISWMKDMSNRLYELWLTHATAHAEKQGRDRLMLTDAKATWQDAFDKMSSDDGR